MYAFADGPYAFRAAARRELAEHADFIKLMASGAAFHPQGVPKEPIIAPDELREAVETAARKGTYVAAHAHADGAIRACIEAGVRTVEHATYLSDETLSLLERTEGCCLVPTLAAMFVSGPDESGFWHERLGAMLDACCAGLQKAYREGLPIGFGTDCAPFSRQYREGTEFAYRKENCGMGGRRYPPPGDRSERPDRGSCRPRGGPSRFPGRPRPLGRGPVGGDYGAGKTPGRRLAGRVFNRRVPLEQLKGEKGL